MRLASATGVILCLICLFAGTPLCRAETIVAPGNVSGTWTLAGEPYIIRTGNITIPDGSSLTIQPGVRVQFDGHHKFIVNGHLNAQGTSRDSVVFEAISDDSVRGWKGLRLINSDSTRLRYCRIEDGNAILGSSNDSTGGGAFISGGTVTFEHCRFQNNRAGNNGGALFVSGGSAVRCSDCVFYLNRSEKDGGAAFVNSSPTSLFERCEFESNWAGKEGGAIHSRGGSPDYLDCEFRLNTSFNSGGAVIVSGQAGFRRCVFASNTSVRSQGGGLYFYDSLATVTLDSCLILNNSTQLRDGGGAYCWEAAPRFTDCQFIGNHSADDGGGIHCYRNGSNATFTRCLFENNYAADRGGGLKISRFSLATVTDCIVRRNTAGGSGGGVFCRLQCEPVFTRCIIEENTASGSGGGVGAIESNPRFFDCTISDNSTDSLGGGISAYSCDVDLARCILTGNRAALHGGGISLRLSSPDILQCELSGNMADSLGGSLYLNRGLPHLANGLLTDNRAGVQGGALYVYAAAPLIEHCTIANNLAADGHALYSLSSQGTILNSIITNGSLPFGNGGAPPGLGIYCSPESWTMRNSLFHDVGLPEYGGSLPAAFGQQTATNANGVSCDGYGNVFGDPEFDGTLPQPYSLRTQPAASLAVNGGAPTLEHVDFAGSARPTPNGSLPDMGCFEAEQVGGANGLWGQQTDTLASGLYRVFGDIIVPAGSRWVINGNTELRFMGPYSIVVYGELQVNGSNGQRVLFHSLDTENRLKWRGLRFYGEQSSASRVNECDIRNAFASATDTSGGGTGFLGGSSAIFSNCSFDQCRSEGYGGGVRVISGSPQFMSCWFYNCVAAVGGAIQVGDGQSAAAIECAFDNCSAESGGAVDVEGGSVVLNGCSASGNGATEGAVVYARNATVVIDNSRLRSNSSSQTGGALHGISSTIAMSGNRIQDNSSGSGGAIWARACTGNVSASELSGNLAEADGGAIFIQHGGLNLERSLLHGNQAGGRGGALVLEHDSSRVTRCTLFNNIASEGSAAYFDSSQAILNSNQVTNNNIALFFRNSSSAVIRYCNFYDNGGRDFSFYGGESSHAPSQLGLVDSVNHLDESTDHLLNLYEPPQYEDAENLMFGLNPSSPSLDAGDPELGCDPDQSIVEIGAFHTSHVDNIWEPRDLSAAVHDSGGVAMTWSRGDLARLCSADSLTYWVERENEAGHWDVILVTSDTLCVVPVQGSEVEQTRRMRVRSVLP